MRFFTLMIIATAMLYLSFSLSLNAQNCQPTLYYFPGADYTGDYHLDRTLDNNYLIVGEIDNSEAGSGDNIHIIKSDNFGNEIWSNTLVWPGDERVAAVRVLPDGSAVIVGSTDSETIATAEQSILLVKISEGGTIQWWRTYGQNATSTYTGTDVEILPSGGFVLSASERSAFNTYNMVFLTTDPNGQQTQWNTKSLYVEDVMHGSGADFGRSSANNVTVLANGDFVFTGITYPQSFLWPAGGFLSVVRTTPSLSTIWETADPYGSCLIDQGWEVEEQADGSLYVAANKVVEGCFDAFGYSTFHKFTGAGEHLESYNVGQGGGRSMLPTSDGNFIIGRINSIAKVDGFGEILWESPQVGNFRSGSGNSLVHSNNGGYILSGLHQNAVMLVEFDSLGNTCLNTLSGVVYTDLDEDCNQDSSEVLISNLIVELNDGEQFANTNPEGWYHMQCDTGMFTVQLHAPNALWEVTCPLITPYDLYLENAYDDETDLDFGLRAVETCPLLSVESAMGTARACTERTIFIQYNNRGTQTAEDVYVVLDFDESLTFLDASVFWQDVGGEYRFYVGDLGVMEYGTFTVQVAIACDAEIGAQTCVTSTIFPTNNCTLEEGHPTDEFCVVIRNSYDPNDKLVAAADTASCWKTALDKLDFTIRFQNTGNDTAYQVVILDTLPDYLDMTTVLPGPGSHDYNLRVLGNNQLMFSFPDIDLLDSMSNVAASQGFVQFSIYPKADIADGTLIRNRAAIYFDHNPPIFTPFITIEQCAIVPLTITEVTTEEVTDCASPNGVLRVVATGGSGEYEYSIDGGENWQFEPEFYDIPSGDYQVLLRDAQGQEYDYPQNPVTVTADLPVIMNVYTQTPTNCGGDDGRVILDAIAPGEIMYSIDDGENFQTEPIFENLAIGTYTILIFNECMEGETLEVEIEDRVLPEITEVSWENPNCSGSGGRIVVAATGQGFIRYSIDNGETWRNNGNFWSLEPGVYQIVVSYGEDICEVTYETEIELFSGGAPPEIVEAEVIASTTCEGDDASIAVIATGESLEYSIDGGTNFQSLPFFVGLSSGVYDVIIRNECEVEDILEGVVVESPAVPELTNIEIENPGCGSENGSINIASGEGLNLVYSIDNWATTQEETTFTDLPAGVYTIGVRNENDCYDSLENLELMETAAPVIQNIAVENPGCTDTSSGTISITANSIEELLYSIDGGVSWSGNASFSNLGVGTYEVMVTNSTYACVTTAIDNPVSITASAFPIINSVEVVNPSAATATDGSITVFANGQAYLFFSINGGLDWQGSNIFTNLPAGEYTVMVRSGAPDCIVTQDNIVLDATVGVLDEKLNPILAVYPNPATDQATIRVELPTISAIEMSLVGVLGNTIRQYPTQRTKAFTHNLDLANLPAGVYYIQVVIAGQLFQKSLVVM